MLGLLSIAGGSIASVAYSAPIYCHSATVLWLVEWNFKPTYKEGYLPLIIASSMIFD